MFLNYLKIAFRNLLKHKVYAAVNIVGLSVAFGVCLLLFLTVYHEFSYDTFHANGNTLYRVYNQIGPDQKGTVLMAPFTPAVQKEFPGEVRRISRIVDAGGLVRVGDKEVGKNIRLVDPDFLQMFTFPLVKGDAATALNSLSSVVLTERVATDLFGSADPVGKTVSLLLSDKWQPFIVSGVLANLPDNSSIQFDVLGRFELTPNYQASKNQWDNQYHSVFLQLNEKVTETAFEQRLRPFTSKYLAQNLRNLKRDGSQPDENGDLESFRLLPMRDMHFNAEVGGDTISAIKPVYLYLLLVIGGLILLIACINFINLSTAHSLTRSKEVGMRKVLGALKMQLAFQFWGEALIICLFSLVLGGLMAFGLLSEYKKLFNNSLSLASYKDPVVLLSILGIFLLVTILAGGYPALFMARFNTIEVLKGKISAARRSASSAGGLRNTLVVVQFAIATLLIVCTLVVWQQISFLRSMPLGYNQNQVVSIPVGSGVNGQKALDLMRDKLAQQPRILSITGTSRNLGRGTDGSTYTSIIGFDYKNRGVRSHWLRVDYDYVKTLDLKLLRGRDFSREFATDTVTAVVINEAMAKQLGEKNPIGTLLNINDGEPPKQVVGVVKNYHFESLKQSISPISFFIDKDWAVNYIFVKIAPDNAPATMDLLKKTWAEVAPKATFLGTFLDENTNRQYRSEERMSQIFMSAAVLAIILSCMGLFAIAIMVMTQRTKEIGVRKVLGASVFSIVALLSRDFLKLVLVGIIIASPLAWWGMSQWLQEFAYKVDIQWWVFALAGLLAVLIAFVTVSFQSIKAALKNPVTSLRSE
ncbi:ABC transporter permease [Nibrella viscosa]|uniref:ABC transporter permease n=1 Tax=Nibrella viscosa TaxID=1084524 RepID=A0ABP8KNZ3_9BACT